ncbi:MAG TPA: formimidoylglutamate deiminase [Caulobacteraceae bacterium]|jgi:formiminoglutamate deiminase|nr:formimidoylglutamate deiminase [Caulobacteraceae bacterium]
MNALWFETALLPGGWARDVRLVQAGGAIASIETGVAARPGDERGAIAVPGVGNLHSHAFQRAMAGLAETRVGDDSFWGWREVMYRFVEVLTPEDVKSIATMAYAEMLECGFTRVGEFHYLHRPGDMAGAIAAAAEESGIGLTLLPVFYAHGGFGGADAGASQARFVHSRDSYGDLVGRCRVLIGSLADGVLGIAPHSLRAVTPDELAAILPLAGDGPIHIHVAEQVREVEECLAWSGARPVAWLLDHAPVDQRWCLVHATHMDAGETARLAASGAVAGLCPITEANLGDGLFPARAYRDAGGAFGVGSDSNVLIDLAEELRLLEYGQRLSHRARAVLAGEGSTGAALFTAALAGGALALGAPAGLLAGASLDIVSLDADHPALAGKSGDAILDAWIFAARGGAVKDVWRRGEKVVAGGRHVRREAIAADYRRVLARLPA